MYTTILVPLDGSSRAETILPYVESLAQVYGSEVALMHVIEPKPHLVESVRYEDVLRKEMEDLQAYLTEQQEKLGQKGISSRITLTHGPVVEEIIRAAEREGADLIVMVSHGRTGLSRVFYGSIAAGVLHRIDRPLLLVRSLDR